MAIITDLRDRPEFFETVADRIWAAFWRHRGIVPAEIREGLLRHMADGPIPFSLVAHDSDAFFGTVSVIESDEDLRPHYTPWVAALWVEPAARRAGIAAALVQEAIARGSAAAERRLYLSALPALRPFYEARGWVALEHHVGDHDLTILTHPRLTN